MDGLQYTSKRVNIKIALRPKTVEIVFHATGTFDRRFEGTKFCAIFTTPYGSDIKGSVRESDGFLTTKVKDMNCKVLVFKDVTIPN